MKYPDLTKFTDAQQLRKLLANAWRLGYEDYAFSIQLRLAELAGEEFADSLEKEFWVAVTCAEEFKTRENGKTTRLSGMRHKHARVGTRQILIDWAMETKTTDGFDVLLGHDRPELTGEAIVLRHPHRFPPEAVASATLKLAARGISIEQAVG